MTVAQFWTITTPEIRVTSGGGGGGETGNNRSNREKEKTKGKSGNSRGGWSGRGGKGGWGKGGAPDLPLLPSYTYFKIDITTANGGSRIAIDEIELLDVSDNNVAIGTLRSGVGTASSTSSASDGPDAVYESFGNPRQTKTVGWATASGTTGWTQWFDDEAIECTSVTLLSNIIVSTPRDFTVQYSDNGSDFTTAATITGETDWVHREQRTFSWSSVGAHRYWRIDITAVNGGAIVDIWNISYITAQGDVIVAGAVRQLLIRSQNHFDDTSRPYQLASGSAGSPGAITAYLSAAADTSQNITIISPKPLRLKSMKFWVYKPSSTFHNDEMPKDFVIKGSNDNITYDILNTVVNETSWADLPIEFSVLV